jgi:hypothetical protein
LHRPQELAALLLGADADVARLALSFNIVRLPSVGFERKGLVADVLHLVDLIRMVDGAAHGVVFDERRRHDASFAGRGRRC